MSVQTTVVFADLSGSTSAYEAAGNAKATQAVTQITTWIAKTFESHGGRVTKLLGDGVLTLFENNTQAIAAVVDMQRRHQKSTAQISLASRMPIRIGVASGAVEIVDGDCYGDAVNVASRLSDLSGPYQIWTNDAAIENLSEPHGAHFRLLGAISIRGRAEPVTVYQIDWQEDVASDFLTVQADLDPLFEVSGKDALGAQIGLTWLESHKVFKSFDLPLHIGRVSQADFVVNDPRVSRTHARIDWRNGGMLLADLSSYGCWVRFAGGTSDVLLRREECILHGRGEIALGAPFSDPSAPTVAFSVF